MSNRHGAAARSGGATTTSPKGSWVFAGGLADHSAAAVVGNGGEQPAFTDGPYVEAKEYLAGVWVWELPDLDAAPTLAAEASRICVRKLEVRAFHSPRIAISD